MDATLVILSIGGALINGLILFIIKSHYSAEKEWRKSVERDISRLENKIASLGTDIQTTRGALDWVCGKQGLERPTYD